MGSRKLNNELNIISKNIFKFRNQNNLSQEKLAQKMQLLGVSMFDSDIYTIEHGKRTVKDFELLAFAIVFNVKIEQLLESDNDLFKLYNKLI